MAPLSNRVIRFVGKPSTAFLVGLLLRLAVILSLFHIGVYDHPETWENGTIAHHIWNGEGFSANWGRELGPTSAQAPVYPYVLAGVFWVFGDNPYAYLSLAVLQSLVISAMVFPVCALTRRWFGTVPAKVVIWFCALGPLYLWFPTRIHHTAFVMGAHPWLLLGWLQLVGDPMAGRGGPSSRSPRQAAVVASGVGALTGLAGLAQPVLLPVYGLLAAWLLARSQAARRLDDGRRVLVAGVVTLLVLTPWTERNYVVHGRLLLVKDSFGKEFWMGNNPYATGTSFAEGGDLEITMAHPPRAFALRGQLSEVQLMDAMEAEAWEYVRAQPLAFLERTVTKIVWFWTFEPETVARNYGRFTVAVHLTHSAYWVSLVFLAILAWATRGIPREYVTIVALYVLVYSVTYGLIHVGQPRYRGEIEFIVLPAASAGVAWILQRLRPRTYERLRRAV